MQDDFFWGAFFGALAAQLTAAGIVLGYQYYREWVRQTGNRAAARRYVEKHGGPPSHKELQQEMEAVSAIVGAVEQSPVPAVGTVPPPESCPTCSGSRDYCCTIKCPAGGCDSWAAVYQFDHRARGQYRTECEKGHWGDLDPRSELLPPPWRDTRDTGAPSLPL